MTYYYKTSIMIDFPEIDVTFISDHAGQFPGRKPGSEKESIR